jgi:hypothetical protein
VPCESCSTTFDELAIEKLGHLQFMYDLLSYWGDNRLLPLLTVALTLKATDTEIARLTASLRGAGTVKPASHPSPALTEPEAATADTPLQAGRSQVTFTAPARTSAPHTAPRSDSGVARALLPAQLHKASPARPRKQPFSWKQLGTYLLSERTLNGLLGLGAFLILAAALVISTINPAGLVPLAHLGMMIVTTLVLFASGILLQRKFHLPRTGLALLTLGTAFIPLDTWTLGRDVLQLDRPSIWLLASLLCLPIYVGCYATLLGRPFALLSAISGGSLLLSATYHLGVPMPWCLAALAPLALLYLVVAHELRRDWESLAWALFWTAQITMPLLMVVLLATQSLPDHLLAGLPAAWRTALLLQRTVGLEYATGFTWWLSIVFSLLAYRLTRSRIYYTAGAWLLPCSFLLTLTKAPWTSAWNGICLALLAAAYLLFGRFVLALPRRSDGSYAYRTAAVEPVFQVALFLALVALLWPIQQFESQILTLVALAMDFAAAALLLRQRAWAYFATFLAVTVQLRQVTVPQRYLEAAHHFGLDRISAGLGFALLATALLAMAERAVRASGESRRPLLDTIVGLGAWRSLFAAPLFAAGYLCTMLAIAFSVSSGVALSALHASDIAALLVVVALYVASTIARRSSAFLYPAAWLFLLSLIALVSQIGHHSITSATDPWLASILAAVGLAYLAVGRYLDRLAGPYNVPLYLSGYLLGVLAVVCASPYRNLDVVLFGLVLCTYAWSALEVHLGGHPAFQALLDVLPAGSAQLIAAMFFQYLAIWLFPIWLLLAQSLWHPIATLAAYGVTLSLLAPVYVLAGLQAQRIYPTYRWPWYLAGYTLAAVGPIAASSDSTLRILALALTIGLCVGSAVQSRRATWLWVIAALLPALLFDVLALFTDQVESFALGLLVLSLVYDALGLTLHHSSMQRMFHRVNPPPSRVAAPFLVGGQVIAGLGLLGVLQNGALTPIVIGYLLGGLHYALSYWTCRGAYIWPLALTLAVAYVALGALVPLFQVHFGLYLLPGIATYLVGMQAIRSSHAHAATVQERKSGGTSRGAAGTVIRFFSGWSAPFTLVGHLGSLVAFAFATSEPVRALSIAIVCTLPILYGICARLSRAPTWLYPCLGAALVAYWMTLYWIVPGLTPSTAALAGIVPVWLLLALAHVCNAGRFHGDRSAHSSFPWASDWARPFLLAGMLTLFTTTGVSLNAIPSPRSLVLASTYALLLTVFALFWQRREMVWLCLAFIGLAYEEALSVAGVPLSAQPPAWAALALLAGCLGVTLQSLAGATARLWLQPLAYTAALLSTLAVAGATANVTSGQASLQLLAITLLVAGALFLLQGTQAGNRWLQLAGLALVAAAYLTELLFLGVTQPAAFLYPTGVALFVLAYVEEHHHEGSNIKHAFEIAALTAVAGTSLLQALGQFGAAGNHLAYATALLLIATALLGAGAALRWTRTFFAAAAALVIAVLILIADPLKSLNVVYLVLLLGCVMIALVVILEQRRQQIPLWLDDVRLRLETWS